MNQNLRRVPFFQGLDQEALAAIQKRMKLRRYKKGDIVFPAGAPGESMFIIESGQVQVLADREGEPTGAVLAHLGPGSFFGEMALLLGERRSATVRVAIDAEIWELHKQDLDDLLQEYPQIAINISKELSRRLSKTIQQPIEIDETNLITVTGQHIPFFVERLKAATGDRVLVVDIGGLRPSLPDMPPDVDVHHFPWDSRPEELAEFLGQEVDEYNRIVMVIRTRQTPLSRKAAELGEVIIEIDHHSTTWLRRYGRQNYWHVLPSRRDVDRAARRVARKLVGIALSAGNSRGLAHVGVIEVLREHSIPIDYIAGTSMGALIGGLYAYRPSMEYLYQFVSHLPKATSFRFGLYDFAFPFRTGILKGEKMRRYLDEKWFGHANIEDLEIPLKVVAADLVTGEEVIFTEGPLADAVRASTSIMGIFQPAYVDGRYLIDGGAVNPVPASTLEDDVNIIIASSVIVNLTERAHRKEMLQSGRLPNVLNIVLGVQEIMEAGIVESRMSNVDVLIQPDVTDVDGMNYQEWKPIVERGRVAAARFVDDIKRLLTERRTGERVSIRQKVIEKVR